MNFKCLKCRQKLQIVLQQVRRRIKCPNCGTKYRLPSLADAESGRTSVKRILPKAKVLAVLPPAKQKPSLPLGIVQPPTPNAAALSTDSQNEDANTAPTSNSRIFEKGIIAVLGILLLAGISSLIVVGFNVLGKNDSAVPTKQTALNVTESMENPTEEKLAKDSAPIKLPTEKSTPERKPPARKPPENTPAKDKLAKGTAPKDAQAATSNPEPVPPPVIESRTSDPEIEASESDTATTPVSTEEYFVPAFPELGNEYTKDGITTYSIKFRSLEENAKFTRDKKAGRRMEIRVWLPSDHVPGTKLPLVLVAPAGTNLMHGTKLPPRKYEAEAITYVHSGIMVVQYSIDGVNPQGELTVTLLNHLFILLRNAQGGVTNGRIALDYTLEKFPDVDHDRIYCAGHSSAGTTALQLASADPRIKKCAAYSPVCFLDRRLKPVLDGPQLVKQIEGIEDYVLTWSPHNRSEHFLCELFIFHSQEDSNEPWKNSSDFVEMMRQQGKPIKFISARSGSHYQSMVDEGIPEAIKWFNR